MHHNGDVAVAGKILGGGRDGPEVQQGQDAMETIAAAGADDALDAVIGKGGEGSQQSDFFRRMFDGESFFGICGAISSSE